MSGGAGADPAPTLVTGPGPVAVRVARTRQDPAPVTGPLVSAGGGLGRGLRRALEDPQAHEDVEVDPLAAGRDDPGELSVDSRQVQDAGQAQDKDDVLADQPDRVA